MNDLSTQRLLTQNNFTRKSTFINTGTFSVYHRVSLPLIGRSRDPYPSPVNDFLKNFNYKHRDLWEMFLKHERRWKDELLLNSSTDAESATEWSGRCLKGDVLESDGKLDEKVDNTLVVQR